MCLWGRGSGGGRAGGGRRGARRWPRKASPGGGGGPTAEPAIEWSRFCRWGMEAGGGRGRVALAGLFACAGGGEGRRGACDSEAGSTWGWKGFPSPGGWGEVGVISGTSL